MASLWRQLVSLPFLSRVRRNHALEHATIHLLSRTGPSTALVGRADSEGFFLYGDVPSQRVEEACNEALRRLRAGEHQLAIHPNCGTSLLTAGFLASATAFFSLLGLNRDDRWRDRVARLPMAVFVTTIALIVAQPLGAAAQRHLTTEGDPGDLSIVRINRHHAGGRTIHRVITRG